MMTFNHNPDERLVNALKDGNIRRICAALKSGANVNAWMKGVPEKYNLPLTYILSDNRYTPDKMLQLIDVMAEHNLDVTRKDRSRMPAIDVARKFNCAADVCQKLAELEAGPPSPSPTPPRI